MNVVPSFENALFFRLERLPQALRISPVYRCQIYEILLAQMGVTSVLIWVTLLFAASIHAVPDVRGPGDFEFGIRARPTGRRHAGFQPTGHSRPHLFPTRPAHPHPVGPSHRPPVPGHGSNTVVSKDVGSSLQIDRCYLQSLFRLVFPKSCLLLGATHHRNSQFTSIAINHRVSVKSSDIRVSQTSLRFFAREQCLTPERDQRPIIARHL